MKKIILLTLGIIMAVSVQAQMKEQNHIPSDNRQEYKILSHSDKYIREEVNHSEQSFQPRNLTFVRNRKNGLEVKARDHHSKLPIFIAGNPTLSIRSGNTPETQGYNFLENAKELMQIQNPSQEFRVIHSETDDLGMTHVKYQQEFKGIPVYGAEVIYHHDGKSAFVNGIYQPTPNIESLTPSYTVEEAEAFTLAEIGGIVEPESDQFGLFDFEKVKTELVIYKGKLAYHLSVYKNIVDLWEYFIDAETKAIIHKYPGMCKFHNHKSEKGNCTSHSHENDHVEAHQSLVNGPVVSNALDLFGVSRQLNTYEVNGTFYMIDAARTMFDATNSAIPDDPIGAIWTIDAFNTSPQNSNFQFDHVTSGSSSFGGKQTGVSAHYNGGQAYMYFKNIHDRESINSSGGNIISLINISDEDGGSLGNAFWNGVAMFYGNGDNSFQPLARGLDVAGHEMSHGVIQNTANLEYQGESGALNESFADVFGAMIDREDWLIGEDVVNTSAYPSGALRSMEDPHNGASVGDFNRGWQPKRYSERFTGSENNGGVHINSGIPNHAFYLFASNSDVGKLRAERVYYRALNRYLTKSSQFIDARLAVVQAAQDLYGANVANRARAAFDAVEIFDGNGTNNQTDVDINPGDDLILFTTENQNDLYIADGNGNLIFAPLTEQDPLSVPSITDDGTEIVFVNQDHKLYYIRLDWNTKTIVEEGVLGFNNLYRNVVFSKDGLRMAALRGTNDESTWTNEVFVFDWETLTGVDYTLFNATIVDSLSTGDVLYADAMQFDFSGEYLMYDAFNSIRGVGGNEINYWDIGFIRVFNNAASSFTLGTDIQKLFTQLPEGVSIGNPTFAKNSDYIVAFDFLQNNSFNILGANIETGDVGEIFADNSRPGYPSYSNDDRKLIFNAFGSNGLPVIGGADIEDDKISSNNATVQLGFEDAGVRWGVWFSNGDRVLSDEAVLQAEHVFTLAPNPASDMITVTSKVGEESIAAIRITDMMGRIVYNGSYRLGNEKNIDISTLKAGLYVLSILTKEGIASESFIKQ